MLNSNSRKSMKALISPKMSQESLKKCFLKIISLSEGTPGISLQAQTKQHSLKIPTELMCNSKCCNPNFQFSRFWQLHRHLIPIKFLVIGRLKEMKWQRQKAIFRKFSTGAKIVRSLTHIN